MYKQYDSNVFHTLHFFPFSSRKVETNRSTPFGANNTKIEVKKSAWSKRVQAFNQAFSQQPQDMTYHISSTPS